MFRNLDQDKLSSRSQNAEKFFYPGADAACMHKSLIGDPRFQSICPTTVDKVFLMTGTNNVEKVYFGKNGRHALHNAQHDIDSLLYYIKTHFYSAKLFVVNILPREAKGKNDIIRNINLFIEKLCNQDQHMTFIDTEDGVHLFKDGFGRRRQNFFVAPTRAITDNVHMNMQGVVRLGKHLKFIAHTF